MSWEDTQKYNTKLKVFKLKRDKLAYATIDNLIQDPEVEIDLDSEEVKTPIRT